MNKRILLISIVLFVCAGCADQHYTIESAESVSLFLRLPDVAHVQFVSSVDNYQRHDTYKNGQGIWEISMPLTKESKYFYVVDGSVYVPDCRFKENDDFGSKNCLYLP